MRNQQTLLPGRLYVGSDPRRSGRSCDRAGEVPVGLPEARKYVLSKQASQLVNMGKDVTNRRLDGGEFFIG